MSAATLSSSSHFEPYCPDSASSPTRSGRGRQLHALAKREHVREEDLALGQDSAVPDGLGAEQIPLAARIIAVADAYHAMTSDRPYRSRMSLAQARVEIQHCAGSHFCPRVVEAFVAVSVRPDFETSAAA